MALSRLPMRAFKTSHIWIFSQTKKDYHVFQPCPPNAITYYYPLYTDTHCRQCKQSKFSSATGYVWLCQSCHFEQLDVVDSEFPSSSIVPMGNEQNCTHTIIWKCVFCERAQLNYFDDKLQIKSFFQCRYCSNGQTILAGT